ncbi:MAG: patatin-like phospholipase family protein [Saprospiraceae bacterium]|nr:patatin-like phospholipase family protein [Saprospiraceae bacterium]
MIVSLLDKLDSIATPKKILTLDGGGIRGILTLGMLEKIEKDLRTKSCDQSLLLGDYYDLIGGTSTGAIIACGLAVGKSVSDLISLYKELGNKIFKDGMLRSWLPRNFKVVRACFKENYPSDKLEDYLKSVFGEITLGDRAEIRCGLAINTKRADTQSLWTFSNHPAAIYYEANKDVKLWELCRASAAAPYYFKAKNLITYNRDRSKTYNTAFIDGGVSLANNPGWQTFLTATTPSFGFNWAAGEEKIHITSLGTGNGYSRKDPNKLINQITLAWSPEIPNLFMRDALENNEILFNLLGKSSQVSPKIDSQFFDLKPILTNPLFRFERHNVFLSQLFLKDLGYDDWDNEAKIESLTEMDHSENMDDLLAIGRMYAAKNIHSAL